MTCCRLDGSTMFDGLTKTTGSRSSSTSPSRSGGNAVRQVGIHEEDQPFWDAVFPASEMQEAPEQWGLVGPKGPKWIPEESAT